MKNTLSDLNNHLFAEMERLGDESLRGDDLKDEIGRADAITKVASEIINNGALALKAEMAKQNSLSSDTQLPAFLEDKNGI